MNGTQSNEMHMSGIEFPTLLQGATKSLVVDAQVFERKIFHSNIILQEDIWEKFLC